MSAIPRYSRALLGDHLAGPLTTLSTTAGPAADLAAAVGAVLRRIGVDPAPGNVVLVAGHAWLDERVLGSLRAADARLADLLPLATEELAQVSRSAPAAADPAVLHDTGARRLAATGLLLLAELALTALGGTSHSPTTVDQSEEVLWALGRAAAAGQVAALFDQGLSGLADRIGASRSDPVRGVHQAVGTLTAEYAHRGPNPWELGAGTWGTGPVELLAIVDLLRGLPDASAPGPRRQLAAATTAARSSAADGWLAVRDRASDVVTAHAQRQRTALARLVVDLEPDGRPDDLLHLTAQELAALRDSGRLPDGLSLRGYDHRALATFRAPVTVEGDIPPAVRWPREGTMPRLGVGGLVAGTGAAPGAAAGPVTVLRSPAEVAALSPGDVLAVPTGTAAWNPLLVAVSALVVDAGRWWSPAAATCRELGIPCVVATEDATALLTTGGHVEVDGTEGVVTVTGGPGRRHHPSGRARAG